jgi:uncharacterized Zn finger protein
MKVETDLEVEAPSLTVDAIQIWTGKRSFELGKRAFRTNALSSTRAEQGLLRGSCQGSATLPYRVEATLSEGGIAAAHCTCGRGEEGRCKHAAALLYAWLEEPQIFAEIEPLNVILERLSPQSLLTLLRRLVRRSDGLADLVEQELPYVAGAVASAEQVNVEALRREVAIALGAQRRPHYDDWTESGTQRDAEGAASTERLRPIFELGDDYLARGRYALATTVYRAIAEATIEAAGGDVGATYPETIRSALRTSAEGLARCLDSTAAAGLRRTILHALIAVVRVDTEAPQPETVAFIQGVLVTRTSSEERSELATLIRSQVLGASAATSASSRLETLLSRLEAAPSTPVPRETVDTPLTGSSPSN